MEKENKLKDKQSQTNAPQQRQQATPAQTQTEIGLTEAPNTANPTSVSQATNIQAQASLSAIPV